MKHPSDIAWPKFEPRCIDLQPTVLPVRPWKCPEFPSSVFHSMIILERYVEQDVESCLELRYLPVADKPVFFILADECLF